MGKVHESYKECIRSVCRDCGVCTVCCESVHLVCIAAKAIDAAYALQSGKAVKKRQSTPYVQMGANGTKPVVTRSSDNWYKHRESGEVEILRKADEPGETPIAPKRRKKRNSFETW